MNVRTNNFQIARYATTLLMVCTFGLLLWAGAFLLYYPDPGVEWIFPSGVVVQSGTNAEIIPGDRILSINHVPLPENVYVPFQSYGETIDLTVMRDNQELNISLPVSSPSLFTILSRLSTIFISFIFWLVGSMVLALGAYSKKTSVFVVFFLVLSLTICLGAISAVQFWAWVAFGLSLCWIGPLAVHTHLEFPATDETPFAKRLLLVVYCLGFVMTIITLWQKFNYLPSYPVYGWVASNLAVVVYLLFRSFRRRGSSENRRKVGVVLIASFLGFGSFLTLMVLPEILYLKPILPSALGFLLLIPIPFSYLFAIFRHKLFNLERYISRTVSYLLVILALIAIYLLSYYGLTRFLLGNPTELSIPGMIITLGLALLANPLYRFIRGLTDTLLYGGWYDQWQILQQINRSLTWAKDTVNDIAPMLCKSLVRTMQIEYINMLLREGELITAYTAKSSIQMAEYQTRTINVDKVYEALNQKDRKFAWDEPGLNKQFGAIDSEWQLMIGKNPQLVIPIQGIEDCLGILVLSFKLGGGIFSKDEIKIVQMAVSQFGVILENVRNTKRITQLHRRLLQAREDERKHLSRDLHDRIIQSLVSLNYQITSVRDQLKQNKNGQLIELQSKLHQILGDTRQICADLRPPTLDTVGLIPALQTRMSELNATHEIKYKLIVRGNEEQEIPDDVSLSLYRVFQEALINIQKHAQADSVTVLVDIKPDMITLEVEDNGIGFPVPQQLETLVANKHFGLIGISELMEMAGGKLFIDSAAGKGCRIRATVNHQLYLQRAPNEIEMGE